MSLSVRIINLNIKNLKIKFSFFIQWIMINITCIELLNTLLCILNYVYIRNTNNDDTQFAMKWIISILCSFPFSLSLIYGYYINKKTRKNIDKSPVLNWCINVMINITCIELLNISGCIFNYLFYFVLFVCFVCIQFVY